MARCRLVRRCALFGRRGENGAILCAGIWKCALRGLLRRESRSLAVGDRTLDDDRWSFFVSSGARQVVARQIAATTASAVVNRRGLVTLRDLALVSLLGTSPPRPLGDRWPRLGGCPLSVLLAPLVPSLPPLLACRRVRSR